MYHTVRVYAYCSIEDCNTLRSKGWKYIDIVHVADYSAGPGEAALKDERRLYVSINRSDEGKEGWSVCKWLLTQSIEERRRWIHYSAVDEVTEDALYNCLLSATEPAFNCTDVQDTDNGVPENPLVTVYSSTYNSRDKIMKPFKSLLKQTYKNWEWIVVDDSTDADTWTKYLSVMHEKLPSRVKVYDTEGTSITEYVKEKRQYRPMHCGLIGKMKGLAVSKGKGDILLELDHDDELVPGALQRIVDAFLRNKSAGFVYSSCCEVHDKTLEGRTYGHDFAFGYGTYWKQWDSDIKTVLCPMVNSRLTATAVKHLVSLPNHPRAWARSAYERAGGYRSALLVADDYDLLMRTFLTNRYAEIPDVLYRQYLYQQTGNTLINVTYSRNEQIQILVRHLYSRYHDRLMKRCTDLGLPLQIRHMQYKNVLDFSDDDPRNQHATIIDYNRGTVPKIVFYHISLNATTDIHISQDYIKDEDTVICIFIEDTPDGDREKMVIDLAKQLPDGKVKWRVTDQRISIDAEKKWAKYIHGVDKLLTEIVM